MAATRSSEADAYRNSQIPGFYCSDPDVQQFCEREAWNFNPYSDLASRKTARGLIDAAIARFGHWRCYDIEFFRP